MKSFLQYINESKLNNTQWYFGNNRSKKLKLSQPQWYAPFFLTNDYNYAQDYSDYGVYLIDLKNESKINILDFSKQTEVNKLNWPKILIDTIKNGNNDLNSIAYDLYDLAYNDGQNLTYINDSQQWKNCANYFKVKSTNIMSQFKPISIWGTEKDHQFLLQMWKDIHDAGFDGFTHIEFGNKVLGLFNLHCIDKISIRPIDVKINESNDNTSKDRGNVSDGYHTFNELYYYRMLYNAAFFNELAKNTDIKVVKSKRHSDGSIPFNDENMFIVQAELPTGQISNHYNMKDWNMFNIKEVEIADKWDGHTPQQATERLKKYILDFQKNNQLNEKTKFRQLRKNFKKHGQEVFPKINSDDDIVFVSGIPKDKALKLLKRACHDVSNFHPEYMEKAVRWSNDQIFGIFNKHDKRNVLAMASVSYNGNESCAAYLHEMTGFIKGGYGKKLVMWLLQKFKKVYGQIALEGSGTKDDPYRPNEKLRDKFYATIPGLKIYRVENTLWDCPADFFYHGISNESIKEFLEKTYGSKQSSLNKDSHQFYCIDKNDEVVAKCKNPIGRIGISTYDDINAAGIGSFEIFKSYRRMGHAKNVLQKLIKKLKSKYSLVYCFVDKDNYPALSLYKQLGNVSNHLNANGQYEVQFSETTEDEQSTTCKNIKNLFDEVVSQYNALFGIDLSYMKFKVDTQPVYTNGEPCYEYDVDECAGDWTSLGWIRLNPDMKSVIDRYGVDWHGSDDLEEFTKIIIAHELAHEVWNNIADDDFKDDILNNARSSLFSTEYIDTVKPNKLDEETFCEYLAHEIVPQKKDISFPDEEIAQLSNQNHIITHRVSNDANRFNVGDVVMTSWGIPYKVSSKLIVNKVEDSPYANDLTPQQLTFLDDFDEIAILELDAQYEPPYTLEQIKAKYPEHIYNKLANDPVHKWRAETGIELIHKEPTEEELDRIWKNWQLMPQDMKDISDKKSIELFGCINADNYSKLKAKWLKQNVNENKNEYLKKFQTEPEVKSIVDKFWQIKQRLKAPQNDIDWWIKKPFNELKQFVLSFNTSNKKERRESNYKHEAIENGAKLLDIKDGYEIWYVPTYEAMEILGRYYKGCSAKWCVASDDPEFWFDNHTDDEFILLIREHPQHNEFDKIALQMENHGRYYSQNEIIPWDLNNNDRTFTNDDLMHYAWLLFKDNGEVRDNYLD